MAADLPCFSEVLKFRWSFQRQKVLKRYSRLFRGARFLSIQALGDGGPRIASPGRVPRPIRPERSYKEIGHTQH